MDHKAVLEFDLSKPDDQKHYLVCLNAGHYVGVLNAAIQLLLKEDGPDKKNIAATIADQMKIKKDK